jgi:thiol-disulfide isomerase/thioredoxin
MTSVTPRTSLHDTAAAAAAGAGAAASDGADGSGGGGGRGGTDWPRWAIRVFGSAVILWLLAVILRGGGDGPLPQGVTAPPTAGQSLNGAPFDLQAWRGEVVVVNVWATWCPPCVMELPHFAAAARERAGQVRFVGLAAESPIEDVVKMTARFGLPYPIVPIGGATQRAWNARALPSTYILDAHGHVAFSVGGALTRAQLDGAIDAVLAGNHEHP